MKCSKTVSCEVGYFGCCSFVTFFLRVSHINIRFTWHQRTTTFQTDARGRSEKTASTIEGLLAGHDFDFAHPGVIVPFLKIFASWSEVFQILGVLKVHERTLWRQKRDRAALASYSYLRKRFFFCWKLTEARSGRENFMSCATVM